MMLAIYIVLAWTLVGCIGALLMGRAIAICSGTREQSETAEAGAVARVASSGAKSLPTAKAA